LGDFILYNGEENMKICSIKECSNKHYARGWCEKHYGRWRMHKDPLYISREYHGLSKHILYKIWIDIKKRCYNRNSKNYEYYYERGILVCSEWKNSAKTFIDWALKNSWQKGLTIDRINNDGNYEPDNCRFVTRKENVHNQRLLQKNNTSGYRGIFRQDKKWIAQIYINGEQEYLGLFDSKRLAAIRYDVEAYLNDNRPRNFIL
jgi:hypothetical protein